MGEEPSGFELVTRDRVDGLCDDISVIRKDIDGLSVHLRKISETLGNRLPNWGSTVMSLLGTVIGAMAMWILNHLSH